MVTPTETQRRIDQNRDKEMRAFCELLRLIWAEQPEITFEELVSNAFMQLTDLSVDERRTDTEGFALLQKLYHDGPHDGLEFEEEPLWTIVFNAESEDTDVFELNGEPEREPLKVEGRVDIGEFVKSGEFNG